MNYPLTVVGSGRIARALTQAKVKSAVQSLRGRDLIGHTSIIENDTLVHATGPAGEQSSREDPGRAFAMHFSLVRELVDWLAGSETRRLMLLGTVAPASGFYGPLKRAGIAYAWERSVLFGCSNRLLVIECGHVIGEGLDIGSPNAGVVARFLRQSVEGKSLVIAGNGEQTIRYTPLDVLANLIMAVSRNWPKVPVVSPVSAPVRVIDVARICLRLANLAFKMNRGVMVHSIQEQPPSYTDPTGELFEVPDLTDVIFQWMRTMEVKLHLH